MRWPSRLPGERIDVEIDPAGEPSQDGFVQLRVVDHGPGTRRRRKADAMRRFWRGDTTRPGTGLGLAIVETLATSSGGRAALVDTVGGGLTVIVELPRGSRRSSNPGDRTIYPWGYV